MRRIVLIQYYKTIDNTIVTLQQPEQGCWVSVEAPTTEEIDFLVNDLGVNKRFILSALDEEERSHIYKEDNQTLIVLDMPVADNSNVKNAPPFYTIPIGFIIIPNYIITLTSSDTTIIEEVVADKTQMINTAFKTHFLFVVTYRIATHFINHLRSIDKLAFQTEKELHRSMKNQELLQLLSLEKSLVYFSTSLKSTEATLEKIARGRVIKLYDEDSELLEDTIIEIKQSIETAIIYRNIIDSIMDATASIISNNLNLVMKVLTSITIVMAIPDLVFGFYGMNVTLPIVGGSFHFPIMVSIIIGALCAFYLYKKGFFDI